jgi:hypothetical protein
MGKDITELDSQVAPLCSEFLANAAAQGIPCALIDTGRTAVEQEVKLRQGVSWTQHSKHLPQPPEMKSKAFDVCPREYLAMKMWNPTGPLWQKLGVIGEELGLKWGGRWTHINGGLGDPGHFEL